MTQVAVKSMRWSVFSDDASELAAVQMHGRPLSRSWVRRLRIGELGEFASLDVIAVVVTGLNILACACDGGTTSAPLGPDEAELADVRARLARAEATLAQLSDEHATVSIIPEQVVDVLVMRWRDAGFDGPPALAGPQGPPGAVGAAGPPGAVGAAGPPGAVGAAGKRGPVGPRGVQGQAGPRGLQGVSGLQGPQGIQGAVGPAGPAGPRGAPGGYASKEDLVRRTERIVVAAGIAATAVATCDNDDALVVAGGCVAQPMWLATLINSAPVGALSSRRLGGWRCDYRNTSKTAELSIEAHVLCAPRRTSLR